MIYESMKPFTKNVVLILTYITIKNIRSVKYTSFIRLIGFFQSIQYLLRAINYFKLNTNLKFIIS